MGYLWSKSSRPFCGCSMHLFQNRYDGTFMQCIIYHTYHYRQAEHQGPWASCSISLSYLFCLPVFISLTFPVCVLLSFFFRSFFHFSWRNVLFNLVVACPIWMKSIHALYPCCCHQITCYHPVRHFISLSTLFDRSSRLRDINIDLRGTTAMNQTAGFVVSGHITKVTSCS